MILIASGQRFCWHLLQALLTLYCDCAWKWRKEHTRREGYQPGAALCAEWSHSTKSPATLVHKSMLIQWQTGTFLQYFWRRSSCYMLIPGHAKNGVKWKSLGLSFCRCCWPVPCQFCCSALGEVSALDQLAHLSFYAWLLFMFMLERFSSFVYRDCWTSMWDM